MNIIKAPIFLVGAERSGTTMLRLMLSHHPQIAWCNEFEYAVDQVSNRGQFPLLKDYYEWLETHRIFQATGFHLDPDLSYPELVNSFLAQKLTNEQKQIVGATVHRHFDRLLHIWPDARFIHIIRDGRDVARSCVMMGWAGNAWMGVERWIEVERLWENFSEKLENHRYIEINYENLIGATSQTLEQLCDFIDVSYTTSMLDYPKSTTYKRPDPNFGLQWKNKMSERDIQLVEYKIASMLQNRGYELSSLPRIQVNDWDVKQLLWQDWWKRVLFRVNRYGFPLLLADFLARRLILKSQAESLKLKINNIDARYIV
jgi:hypothetical protein